MKKLRENYIILFFAITFVFILTSCEKEIEVDLNSIDPKIVIEGLVAKDSLAKVSITKTKDFNSNNVFPPVSGATVLISDSEGNSETLLQNQDGLYVSKTLRGKENVTYNLSILVDEQYFTSVSRMPEEVKIITVKMYYIETFGYAMPMVIFQDPPGRDNYYRNILFMNGGRMNIGNEATDGTERAGSVIERLLPVFDDDKDDSRKVEKGDVILVELQSIDKGVYTFFDTLGRMSSSQNNPTSNIVGGALGYFSAYSFDRMSIIADW